MNEDQQFRDLEACLHSLFDKCLAANNEDEVRSIIEEAMPGIVYEATRQALLRMLFPE